MPSSGSGGSSGTRKGESSKGKSTFFDFLKSKVTGRPLITNFSCSEIAETCINSKEYTDSSLPRNGALYELECFRFDYKAQGTAYKPASADLLRFSQQVARAAGDEAALEFLGGGGGSK